MGKQKINIDGFTPVEIAQEAGVALYTVVLHIKRGGRRKGPQIEAAVERLQAKRIQALRERLAQLQTSLQNQ